MSSKIAKVVLACSLGALIGTMAALELKPMFWWIGLLVGFAIGYLTYEWHEIPVAVKQAWRVVKPALRQLLPSRIEDPLVREGRLWAMGVLAVVAIYLAVFCFLIIIKPYTVLSFVSLLLAAMSIMLGVAVINSAPYSKDSLRYPPRDQTALYQDQIVARKKLVKYGNPLMVFVGWPLYGVSWTIYKLIRVSPQIPGAIVRAVVATGKAIPRTVVWTWNLAKTLTLFLWLVFRQIHSNIRWLCAIDAALGALIGCMAGSAIIGALAGAVIGFLNYQLVSVRLLKLVPDRASQ